MAIGFDAPTDFDDPNTTFNGGPRFSGSTGGGGGFAGGGSAGGIQVIVRNPDLSFAGELEYTQLELVPRFNALGSWTVDCSYNGDPTSPAGALLVRGAGIAAVANGQIIMSGPATKPDVQNDGNQVHLTIGGVDDLIFIQDRQAHQDPPNAETLTAFHTYDRASDDREGPAETVIKQFVNVNAGPGAIANRQVPGLTIETDQGRGLDVEESGRMQNLFQLIANLAKPGAVGFRCVQTQPGVLEFSVYLPEDKRNSVVFSIGLGNVSSYEYSAERPTANFMYCGGDGTGLSRVFEIGSAVASLAAWGRIETFGEDSSAKPSKLHQVIVGTLLGDEAQYRFSANAVDTGSHQWAPLATSPQVQTYDLGDVVTVAVDGQTINEIIRELHVTVGPEGRTVTPIIGSTDQGGRPEARFYRSLIDHIRSLRVQTRDLQRR